jgi:tetratricopeptide (TPR) repeat protein
MFCGAKILLKSTDAAREHQDLLRYRELREVAMKAKNYKESVEYCNSILQIDPNDMDSWIAKAIAVCNSSTEADDRYEEAVEYLRKAAHIAPNDERVTMTYDNLTQEQSKRYLVLAAQNAQRSAGMLSQGLNGSKYTLQSMDYNLKALKCVPDNLQALKSVELMVRASALLGMKWGSDVQSQLNTLASLQAKKSAEERLPQLHAELGKLQSTLVKLKTEKGLFVGGKVKNTEAAIQKIQSEITSCKKAAAYDVIRVRI